MPLKVVLAYSGGLDTSIIVPWLKENYNATIVCMAGDVGQVGCGLEAVATAEGVVAHRSEWVQHAVAEGVVHGLYAWAADRDEASGRIGDRDEVELSSVRGKDL